MKIKIGEDIHFEDFYENKIFSTINKTTKEEITYDEDEYMLIGPPEGGVRQYELCLLHYRGIINDDLLEALI